MPIGATQCLQQSPLSLADLRQDLRRAHRSIENMIPEIPHFLHRHLQRVLYPCQPSLLYPYEPSNIPHYVCSPCQVNLPPQAQCVLSAEQHLDLNEYDSHYLPSPPRGQLFSAFERDAAAPGEARTLRTPVKPSGPERWCGSSVGGVRGR